MFQSHLMKTDFVFSLTFRQLRKLEVGGSERSSSLFWHCWKNRFRWGSWHRQGNPLRIEQSASARRLNRSAPFYTPLFFHYFMWPLLKFRPNFTVELYLTSLCTQHAVFFYPNMKCTSGLPECKLWRRHLLTL